MPGVHSKPVHDNLDPPPIAESAPAEVATDTLYVGERVVLIKPGDLYNGHIGYVVALLPVQCYILLPGGLRGENLDPSRPFDGICCRRKRSFLFNGIRNAGPALPAEGFPAEHPAPPNYVQAPYPLWRLPSATD